MSVPTVYFFFDLGARFGFAVAVTVADSPEPVVTGGV
jgi:hypothetical protein